MIIEHKPGAKHQNADHLSRTEYGSPPPEPEWDSLENKLSILSVNGQTSLHERRNISFTCDKAIDITQPVSADLLPDVAAMADMATLQRDTEDISPLIEYIEHGIVPANTREALRIIIESD